MPGWPCWLRMSCWAGWLRWPGWLRWSGWPGWRCWLCLPCWLCWLCWPGWHSCSGWQSYDSNDFTSFCTLYLDFTLQRCTQYYVTVIHLRWPVGLLTTPTNRQRENGLPKSTTSSTVEFIFNLPGLAFNHVDSLYRGRVT